MTLLCGRYEGFDERIVEHFATDAVSIGRYVLAGGELAAMVVCDAILRKLPGSLGHSASAGEESYSVALEGRPEYPHYTRPAELPRLEGPRRPAVRPPRADPQLARAALARSRRGSRGPGLTSPRQVAGGAASSSRGMLRYHPALGAASLRSRPFPFASYVLSHRKSRARSAAPRPVISGGRPPARPFPGHRGHAQAHPGVRGRRHQASGSWCPRDLHRAQAVLRRRRRAHVPRALAQDREDRDRRSR